MQQHFNNLFSNKRKGPGEDVHKVGEYVRVLGVVELLDVQGIALKDQPNKSYLKFNNSSFVVVDIAVVGGRENSDDYWEFRRAVPFVHFVAIKLSLVSP